MTVAVPWIADPPLPELYLADDQLGLHYCLGATFRRFAFHPNISFRGPQFHRPDQFDLQRPDADRPLAFGQGSQRAH